MNVSTPLVTKIVANRELAALSIAMGALNSVVAASKAPDMVDWEVRFQK
jgi:hypothetical protein